MTRAAAATIGSQVAVVHLPWLSSAFETRPLKVADWALCVVAAAAVLVVTEIEKWVVRRRGVATPCPMTFGSGRRRRRPR